MFKKLLITICFLCVGIQVMFSEELFRVLDDTPAWAGDIPMNNTNVTIKIPKNSLISNISNTYFCDINKKESIANSVIFRNTEYSVAANTFISIDTEEIFNESFITKADQKSEIWINAYFLEVLNEGDRNVLMPYEQGWINYWNKFEYEDWYEQSRCEYSLEITQGTLKIGGLLPDLFLIRQIENIKNGYRVRVTWNMYRDHYYDPERRSNKVNLPSKENAPVFDFYFIVDGDYMDVYYSIGPNSSNRVFCSTFVRIDAEIRKQINQIIQYNSYSELPIPFEPQEITYWPRRADGSMDYPHHPLTVPRNSSAVYKFDETVVKIEPVTENNTHNENKNVINQENGEENSLPLPLLLAIIGGVAVIAGVVVVVMRKKK